MSIFSPYTFELIFPARNAEFIQTRNWSRMNEWAPISIRSSYDALWVQYAKDYKKGNTRLRRNVFNLLHNNKLYKPVIKQVIIQLMHNT